MCIRQEATFVTVQHPATKKHLFHGPCELVLDLYDKVWIKIYVMEDLPDEVVKITEGKGDCVDQYTHDCVVSLPASWCSFHDIDEAESIHNLMAIDQQLLSYAQG